MSTEALTTSQTSTASAGPETTTITNKEPWTDGVMDIKPEERALLEQYAGLAPDAVMPHVLGLRDRAFRVWSYACIGQMRFLAFNLRKLPFYGEVRERLRAGATFADAGCCFGQELRHLAFHDQIPADRLYGFDLDISFIDMGYELFRDRDSFGAHFAVGNVLEPVGAASAQSTLAQLDGKIDIVFCSSLLHVFSWDQMIAAVKRMVALTTEGPGAIICGRQLGSTEPGDLPLPSGSSYRHSPESFKKFFAQVGEETGTRWKVESELYAGVPEVTQNQNAAWMNSTARMIWFKATKL
jgi:hypothetical protein